VRVTSNSVPLVSGDRKAFGVWRSACSVPGARGDVGVLDVSWKVHQIASRWSVEIGKRSAFGARCVPFPALAAMSAFSAFPGER
jgi:hypothetical protein